MALHEDLLYDRRSGQPLTAGYYGARIPTHLRRARRSRSSSSRATTATARSARRASARRASSWRRRAVGNAIFNAIGRRMKDLPITARQDPGRRSHEGLHQRQRPRRSQHAATLAQQAHARRPDARRSPAAAATCSALVKERIVPPDVIVNLKTIKGARPGRRRSAAALTIGGLITLDALEPARGRSAASTRCWPKRRGASRRRRSATSARWPATSASGRGAGTTATGSRASRPAATSASRSPARTSSTPSSAAARATSSIRPTRRRRWWRSTRRSASSDRPANARCRPPEFFVLPRQNAGARERARRRRGAGGGAAAARRRPARAARTTR